MIEGQVPTFTFVAAALTLSPGADTNALTMGLGARLALERQ